MDYPYEMKLQGIVPTVHNIQSDWSLMSNYRVSSQWIDGGRDLHAFYKDWKIFSPPELFTKDFKLGLNFNDYLYLFPNL